MKTPLWKLVAIGSACLAIGIAGTAGADALITGKNVKDGSIGLKDLSAKAKQALKGARGPAGPTGPTGAAGQNGAPGGPGTSGSTAPALMLGTMAAATNAVRYAPPVGGGGTVLSEATAQTPVPPGTGLIARDFAASVSVAPGPGQSIGIAFRIAGSDTTLACTIADTDTSCSAPGATVALPAGSRMSMRATASSGTPANVTASWGFRIVF